MAPLLRVDNLSVSMTSLISSVELVYPPPEKRALMSDDWKWVLRTASSTRPVTRFLPETAEERAARQMGGSSIFADTRGLVRVSAGDDELPVLARTPRGCESWLHLYSAAHEVYLLALPVIHSTQVTGYDG